MMKKSSGKIFAGLQNVTDAVQAEHIGVFVRVNHHRARAVRHDRPREFRRGEHRAFDVEMAVNQAWREIRAAQIDGLASFVIADADDAPVLHGDVRGMNFAAEDVDQPARS